MNLRNSYIYKTVGLILLSVVVVGGYLILQQTLNEENVAITDYKNTAYLIDGQLVQLIDGYSESDVAPGSATKIITRYFGNELFTDLDGDGDDDVAFVLTQETGGSGTYYYAVAALNTGQGYVGSDGYLLGDRIAPQSTNISPNPRHKNVVVFNYADRKASEPMSAQPSVGQSAYLKLVPETMQWAIVEPDFEGESTDEASSGKRLVTITHSVDVTALPLGDGNISTAPEKGNVYSCQTQFSAQKAGADHAGDWVHGDTWNLNQKIAVQGSVSWPSAWFKSLISGLKRVLTGNGLPVGSNTGTFPVAQSDPAYQIDRNPNAITAQSVSYELPLNPTMAAFPSCVPMGPVGVMLNGVALFNALDAGGRDAVANEVQDSCNGHPESTGEYHYHGPSDCVEGADEPNKLIGYALDGFGIYSRFDADGNEYSSADLDECHGITSDIEWDGKMVNMYHYVITQDYPYTVGCFRGTPVVSLNTTAGFRNTQASTQNGGGPSDGTPPQGAIDACSSKGTGAACNFTTPQGAISGSCKTPPESNVLACVPVR